MNYFFGKYGYTPEYIIKMYQKAHKALIAVIPAVQKLVPSIDSINAGIMLYNIPLNLFKYFVCALLAVITYLIINNKINKE